MGFMAGPPLGLLLLQVFMCLNKDKNSSLSWAVIPCGGVLSGFLQFGVSTYLNHRHCLGTC